MSVFINEFLKCYLTNPCIILTIILGLLSTIYNKKIIGWFEEHWTKQASNKCPICGEKLMKKMVNMDFFGDALITLSVDILKNTKKCNYM